MISALPVAVNRCQTGCALYLRRQGLVEVAKAEPERVRLLVCEPCFNVLAAGAVPSGKGK